MSRQFIQASYPGIKKNNPDLPILIREASGTPARAFVRLGMHTMTVLFSLSQLNAQYRIWRREGCGVREPLCERSRKTSVTVTHCVGSNGIIKTDKLILGI